MTYNPSDLNSVLSTLSTLTNPPPSPDNNDSDYEPPEPVQTPASTPAPSTTRHTETSTVTDRNRARDDPSKITTWPPALQHVMRTVAANEATQRKIRRLIQNQHAHERQWWEGREALIRKQGARGAKRGELERVLRSVGAPIDGSGSKAVSSAGEDQAELKAYDDKVYKASTQMAEALVFELKALGIPFFSIRESCVCDAQKDEPREAALSSDELATLQRRMLELLQDLCRE